MTRADRTSTLSIWFVTFTNNLRPRRYIPMSCKPCSNSCMFTIALKRTTSRCSRWERSHSSSRPSSKDKLLRFSSQMDLRCSRQTSTRCWRIVNRVSRLSLEPKSERLQCRRKLGPCSRGQSCRVRSRPRSPLCMTIGLSNTAQSIKAKL